MAMAYVKHGVFGVSIPASQRVHVIYDHYQAEWALPPRAKTHYVPYIDGVMAKWNAVLQAGESLEFHRPFEGPGQSEHFDPERWVTVRSAARLASRDLERIEEELDA